MYRSLAKSTGEYIFTGFMGQVLISVLWLMLAWWLEPSQIGLYALVLFVIEFFSAVSMFAMGSTFRRFYYTYQNIKSIFNNTIVIFLCSSILTAIGFFLSVTVIPFIIPSLSPILENNKFLFLAIIIANAAANFSLKYYPTIKKPVIYRNFQLFKVVLFCSLALALVFCGFGIIGIFYSLLFSSLVITGLFLFYERDKFAFKMTSFTVAKELTAYAFPLMLYIIIGITISYFGRVVLERYASMQTVGIYSFFLIFTLQVNGLWSSFNRAWTPEIYSRFSDNKEKVYADIESVAFLSCFFYLFLFIAFIVVGKLFLFELLFENIYVSNINVFYILLIGPLFTAIYTSAYPLYYYEKKTQKVLFISVLLSVSNVVLTFFMVKLFNQIGAAISFSFMMAVTALCYLGAFRKSMGIPKKIIRLTVTLLIIMTFAVFLFLRTSSTFLFLGTLFMGLGAIYRIGNLFRTKDIFVGYLMRYGAKLKN